MFENFYLLTAYLKFKPHSFIFPYVLFLLVCIEFFILLYLICSFSHKDVKYEKYVKINVNE